MLPLMDVMRPGFVRRQSSQLALDVPASPQGGGAIAPMFDDEACILWPGAASATCESEAGEVDKLFFRIIHKQPVLHKRPFGSFGAFHQNDFAIQRYKVIATDYLDNATRRYILGPDSHPVIELGNPVNGCK